MNNRLLLAAMFGAIGGPIALIDDQFPLVPYPRKRKSRCCSNYSCKIYNETFTRTDFDAILDRKPRQKLMKAARRNILKLEMSMPPVLHPPGSFGEIL